MSNSGHLDIEQRKERLAALIHETVDDGIAAYHYSFHTEFVTTTPAGDKPLFKLYPPTSRLSQTPMCLVMRAKQLHLLACDIQHPALLKLCKDENKQFDVDFISHLTKPYLDEMSLEFDIILATSIVCGPKLVRRRIDQFDVEMGSNVLLRITSQPAGSTFDATNKGSGCEATLFKHAGEYYTVEPIMKALHGMELDKSPFVFNMLHEIAEQRRRAVQQGLYSG